MKSDKQITWEERKTGTTEKTSLSPSISFYSFFVRVSLSLPENNQEEGATKQEIIQSVGKKKKKKTAGGSVIT